MNYTMMSYTMARQCKDGRPDMAFICRTAREAGLETMDVDTLYHYTAKDIRKIADDHGIRIVCYTFFPDLNHPDAKGRAPGLEAVRQGLEVANVLGAPVIMLPITAKAGQTRDQSRQYVIEGLKDAVKLGEKAGVQVSVEHFPQPDSPFVTSKDINQALEAVPGLKVTFDCGNCLTGGEDPRDGFLNSKDSTVFAHFKDWIRQPAGTGMKGLDGNWYKPELIGRGIVDYPALLKTMIKAKYSGYINIEYEGNEIPAAEAVKLAVEYLRAEEAKIA